MQAIDSCVHNFSVVGSNQVYASLVLSSAIGVDESGNKVAPAPVEQPRLLWPIIIMFQKPQI